METFGLVIISSSGQAIFRVSYSFTKVNIGGSKGNCSLNHAPPPTSKEGPVSNVYVWRQRLFPQPCTPTHDIFH